MFKNFLKSWFVLPILTLITLFCIFFALKPFLASLAVFLILFSFLFFKTPATGVVFLALFAPFSDFLIKWVPQEYYLIFRFATEVLTILLFLIVMSKNLSKRKFLQRTPIDIPLALFLLTSFVSGMVNQVSFRMMALGLGTLVRYVVLFYVAANINWNKKNLENLTTALLGLTFFETLIGLSQAMIGAPANEFFAFSEEANRSSSIIYRATTQVFGKGKWIFATFGRYNLFGGFVFAFLLLGLGIYLTSSKKPWFFPPYFFLTSLALLLSYSRYSWLGAYIGLLFILFFSGRKKLGTFAAAIPVILTILLLVIVGTVDPTLSENVNASPLQRFLGMFSPYYIQQSLKSDRFFIITVASKKILSNVPLLGLGPGSTWSSSVGTFSDFRYQTLLGLPVEAWFYLGDVGWLALLAQVGIFGLGFFVWLMLNVLVLAKNVYKKAPGSLWKGFALGFLGIWVAVFLTNFFSFNLTYRSTSLYFWLLAGVLGSL